MKNAAAEISFPQQLLKFSKGIAKGRFLCYNESVADVAEWQTQGT